MSDGKQPEKCPVDNNEQCSFVVMKARYALVGAADRLKELIILFFSALLRPYLEYCIQFWAHQSKRESDKIDST